MSPQEEFLRRLKNVRKQMGKRDFDTLIIYSCPGSLRFGQRGHVVYISNQEPYYSDTMMVLPQDKKSGALGVGLEVHEWPFIGYHDITHDNAYRDTSLRANTVISLEPTIGIPNVGGFQLEDEFVVTKTGSKRLNDIHQEIIICR